MFLFVSYSEIVRPVIEMSYNVFYFETSSNIVVSDKWV